MESETPTLENTVESVVKERKKPNITPEDRAARAERMRAMATSRNELLRKQKAERFSNDESASKPKGKKTVRVAPTSEVAEEPKPPATPPTPMPASESVKTKQPKAPKKEPKKAPAKRVKTLVIQSSSDSEDYGESETSGSESEEEVIYIAKKSSSKSSKLTKPKKSVEARPRVSREVESSKVEPPAPPQIRVKFF